MFLHSPEHWLKWLTKVNFTYKYFIYSTLRICISFDRIEVWFYIVHSEVSVGLIKIYIFMKPGGGKYIYIYFLQLTDYTYPMKTIQCFLIRYLTSHILKSHKQIRIYKSQQGLEKLRDFIGIEMCILSTNVQICAKIQ